MSVFDGQRLGLSTFKLDVERMRRGWYSDKYFMNIVSLLSKLSSMGYRYNGDFPMLKLPDGEHPAIGDLEVEMQWFTRRKPLSIVNGVDKALAMLQTCTGYLDDAGNWVDKYDSLQVEAVQDGVHVYYDGDPRNVRPVLRVRGKYRYFAMLETPTLGALTRGTRIATNVYDVLHAAGGKDVLFFPARFDAHEVQAADGYAYHVAVLAYNANSGRSTSSQVSTDEQGDWWGGAGGGTVAHAAIACFVGDTAETMITFAANMPPSIPRIALVDFQNDCIETTRQVMDAMFRKYCELLDCGREDEAIRYRLYGVRPDTSGTLRDQSLEPLGDSHLDNGVNPRLCFGLRREIDRAWEDWQLPVDKVELARMWCRQIKIIATGGFTPKRIEEFERMNVPVDIYGVGSALFSNCAEHGTANDFTADIVKVKIGDVWLPVVKAGRTACDNADLQPVNRLTD
jgi:nicotinate phosphoribosyltransferase